MQISQNEAIAKAEVLMGKKVNLKKQSQSDRSAFGVLRETIWKNKANFMFPLRPKGLEKEKNRPLLRIHY